MSGLAFLLIALVISVIGSLILWLRSRRPRGVTSAIDEFRREMQALAPDARARLEARRRSHRGGTTAG